MAEKRGLFGRSKPKEEKKGFFGLLKKKEIEEATEQQEQEEQHEQHEKENIDVKESEEKEQNAYIPTANESIPKSIETSNDADKNVQDNIDKEASEDISEVETVSETKIHTAEESDVDIETKQDDSESADEIISKEKNKSNKGFFRRLVSGLTKTRNGILSGIDSVFSSFSSIDDEFYEELEEILVMADIGIHTASIIIEDLQKKVKELKIKEPSECKSLLIESIKEQMKVEETAYEFENQTSVVLLIGVNGVGKTTSIGKLSSQLKGKGKKVIVAAADTFRAAAIEQLEEWTHRAGVDIIAQQEGSDPAAVIFDAVTAAKARNADVLLCDTAGRLHNKKNLMEELRKINRVIDREYQNVYRETLVVLDGTTGQNALAQAKQFNEVANITGIILTKLDGTAKGGIAIAIQSELGIPVKYIGIGEKIDDLQKFNANDFVDALFAQNDNNNE